MLARRTALSLALVLVASTLVAACSRAALPDPPPRDSSAVLRTVDPGLTEWSEGRVEAAGYIAWVDLEGGFWALNDHVSQSTTDRPVVIAVLLPGRVGEPRLAVLDGEYAVVSGVLQGGASIRMAGPEIVVEKAATALPGTRR